MPRIVMPFGFSRSEPIFDNSLLGVMPIEQVRPVASKTACLMREASERLSSAKSLRSI